MTNKAWMFSLVLPGSGQALEGRYLRGILLLFLSFAAINLFTLGKWFYSGGNADILIETGLLIFGVTWLMSIVEMFVVRHTSDPRRFAEEIEAHLHNAISYYLAGDMDAAEKELRAMLKRRPRDIEAHLYLAGVFRENGNLRKARDQYNKVIALDEEGKWSWQIEREIQSLKS